MPNYSMERVPHRVKRGGAGDRRKHKAKVVIVHDG